MLLLLLVMAVIITHTPPLVLAGLIGMYRSL
jgi:hypothetical protein